MNRLNQILYAELCRREARGKYDWWTFAAWARKTLEAPSKRVAVQEVAYRLGAHLSQVYRLVDRGYLPYVHCLDQGFEMLYQTERGAWRKSGRCFDAAELLQFADDNRYHSEICHDRGINTHAASPQP